MTLSCHCSNTSSVILDVRRRILIRELSEHNEGEKSPPFPIPFTCHLLVVYEEDSDEREHIVH